MPRSSLNSSRYGYLPFASFSRLLMWHERIHGLSSSNDLATEPFSTSVVFEFHVSPTDLCPHASMMVLQFFGSCVTGPWTSTQISTPKPSACLPHSWSALPICSNV